MIHQNRRMRREQAFRVWKALGEPGSFKDFWRKQYETPVRIPYSTSGTASNTSDRRKGLLARIKRFFSRRTR